MTPLKQHDEKVIQDFSILFPTTVADGKRFTYSEEFETWKKIMNKNLKSFLLSALHERDEEIVKMAEELKLNEDVFYGKSTGVLALSQLQDKIKEI